MRRAVVVASLLLITGSMVWSFHTATASIPPYATVDNAQLDAAICQQIVREALQQVGRDCAELGRNEACYGHAQVDAIPRAGVTLPTFSASGDIVALTDLAGLFTRPYNPDTATWGVAMMSVQADLPESATDTMRFVLFGDATVTDASTAPPLITCAATNSSRNTINIRSAPTTSAPILDLHAPAETLTVTGRTADGWLRARLETGDTGWVAAQFYDVTCTTNELPTVSATDAPATSPMQVIELSGGGTSACSEAPNGLLIQAPEGQTANVVVNGVEMRFASSGFISVDASGMSVTGLTGEITVNVPADAAPNAGGLPQPQPQPQATVAVLATAIVATAGVGAVDPPQDVQSADGVLGESADDEPSMAAGVPPTDDSDGPAVIALALNDSVSVLPGLTTRIEYVPSEGRFFPSEPNVSAETSATVETLAVLRETVINNTDYDEARDIVTGDLSRIRDAVDNLTCRVGETLTIPLPPLDTATLIARGLTFLGGDKTIVDASLNGDQLIIICQNPGQQGLAYSVATADTPASVRGFAVTVMGDQIGRANVPDASTLPIDDTAATTILPTRYCTTGETVRIDAPPATAGTSYSFSASHPSIAITLLNPFAAQAVCGRDDFSVVISAARADGNVSYLIQPVLIRNAPSITDPAASDVNNPPTTTPITDDDGNDDDNDDDNRPRADGTPDATVVPPTEAAGGGSLPTQPSATAIIPEPSLEPPATPVVPEPSLEPPATQDVGDIID